MPPFRLLMLLSLGTAGNRCQQTSHPPSTQIFARVLSGGDLATRCSQHKARGECAVCARKHVKAREGKYFLMNLPLIPTVCRSTDSPLENVQTTSGMPAQICGRQQGLRASMVALGCVLKISTALTES